MSDFMEMAENYKKIWERSLAERTQEIELLKAENEKLREALNHVSISGPQMPICCIDAGKAQDLLNHVIEVADKALTGES
jgi:hypothetical protein